MQQQDMASSSRLTSRTKSNLLDDLDLQPVREVRGRVLNDVPHDDDSSPPSPKVKFNFVNVALPKLPRGGAEDYERPNEKTSRSRARKDMEPKKERQRRVEDLQRNMEEGRREFVSQLLRRGVPMWEEVSEEEHNSRFIGGTNPFQYQHRSRSRDATNITQHSKVPSAVWEDVSKVPSISQNIPSEDGFYSGGSSHNNTERKGDTILDNDIQGSREHVRSDYEEGREQHNEPLQQSPSELQPASQTSSPGRPSEHSPTQCSNTHDDLPIQDSARERQRHHMVIDDESSHAEGREEVPERSAIRMKRKSGGKIEESVITTRSWRVGERLARERYGPLPQAPQDEDQKDKGEEEKHERESTRESRNKRDLSASSRDETQPPRSRQRFASQKDEAEREPAPPKTPPRVRSYKQEEIQKYMESKRSERLKSLKEMKTQRQLEKLKKEERLKELAQKTKELAQTGKKQSVPEREKNQDANSKGDAHIENSQWGCPSDCHHDTVQSPSLNPVVQNAVDPVQATAKSKDESSAKKGRIEKISGPSGEKLEGAKVAHTKKTKKEGKKRRKKRTVSLSDSDSISEIVSRTLEECERQVRSSSISLESISSSSSVSLSSSDSEMKSSESQSSTSSFDFRPKPRVLSLGQMAQRLTSRIEKEEENLRLNTGQKREGEPDSVPLHQSKVSRSGVKEIPPRETLSYSQIQTLSVDELIARMTAMLPQSASRVQGRVDQVPTQTTSTKHNDPIEKNTQASLTPQMIHQRLRQEQQSRKQTPSPRMIAAEKEDIPDLLPPEIPTLQLSGGNIARPPAGTTVPQPKVNTLLSLPGNNIPSVKGQVVQEVPNGSSAFQFVGYNPQKIPGTPEPHSYGRKNMMEKAALCIQSVYRGYCVRKVTSAILGKKFGRPIKKIAMVSQTIRIGNSMQHTTPVQNKFFKKHSLKTDQPNRGEFSSSDECNEVDWRKIKMELENKSLIPKRDAPYIFKKTDLPEWIKPYIVLSETGNIDNFIESRGREQETIGQLVAEGEHSHHPQNNIENNDSDKENIEVLDNTELDATLTEGPISDVDKRETHNVQEKETQTNLDAIRYEKKRKEKTKDQKNQKLIREPDKNTFVDLKKTFTGEKTLLLSNAGTSIKNTEINEGAVAMKPKASSPGVKYVNVETSKALKSMRNRSEKHEVTIEEGPLDEESRYATVHTESKVSSSESERPYPSDLEEGEILGSSGVQETPYSSVGDDDVRAPHQLLGKGPHFAPASLRLRLNAELMYQDTVGEALSQLRDAEQFRILSKSSQEAIAYSQSLALEHQERLAEEQRRKEEEKKKEEEKERQEEDKRRKAEEDRRIREDQKRHQEALLSVERMEREAKDRLTQLEREVRARAEQILSSTTHMAPPQPAGSQPDVIAAAAVAAVGATISQWERLRPARGGASSGLESSAVILSQGSVSSSMKDSHHYSSTFTGSSDGRSRSRGSRSEKYSSSRSTSNKSHKSSSVSERISDASVDRSKSSVAEDLPSSIHSTSTKYSVEEQVLSAAESSRRSSVSEEISTERSIPTVGHRKTTQSESSVQEEEGLVGTTTSQDRSVIEEVESDVQSNKLKETKSVSEALISTRMSQKDDTIQSSYGDRPSTHITEETPGSGSGSQEFIEDIAGTSTNVSSGLVSSTMRESLPSKSATSLSEVYSKEPSKSESNQVQESIRTSMHSKESVSTSRTKSSSPTTSKSRTESVQNESKEKSDAYSESFEVESGSDGSSSSSAIPSQSKRVRDYNGDLSIVFTSANILTAMDQMDYTAGGGLPSGMLTGGSSSALGMTLNMMESMQKEEELRHQHQKALLKLQEQSLIEEARWKLAALQSEGGPGLRKKQRAVLLQLREQRAHLRRLIETQNLAAQQRRLLLLQHYHLLATTNGAAAVGARGCVTTSRGQSPNPTSPRLTPRMMEVNISSSSESQDDISLHLSLKGKDAGSSSPSDGGGREKRRSHSEERKRISSMRLQEKRRATEVDLLHQQLLQEEKEIFRLKSQDKDPGKVKRKGEIGSRRPRDKREKSPTSSSPLATLVQDNLSSTGSSVPEESVDASAHDSQSSVPEEGGTESVCHSDAASSVSEHDGLSLRSKSSIPLELSGAKKLPSSEEIINSRLAGSARSSSARTIASEIQTSHVSEDIENVSAAKYSKSAESKSNPQSSVDSKISKSSDKTSSIRTLVSDSNSKSTDRPSSVKSEGNEKTSKSAEGQSTIKTSSIVSEIPSRSRTDTAVSEEVSRETKSQAASASSRSGNESNHASETKSGEGRSSSQKLSSAKALPLPIRVPLSPRSPHRHHRRYSSESDDSFTLSQTETASDISDGEGKLLALKEQLASRRAEADRLRREKRRLRRERLASQEHALRQQISAYDSYIQQARMELEKESKELQQASMVRPLIKKPQVAETKKSRQSESILTSPDRSDISETSILSEGAKSEQSEKSSSKSKEEIIKASSSVSPRELESQKPQAKSLLPESTPTPVQNEIIEKQPEKTPDVLDPTAQDQQSALEDADASRVSRTSSISEDYSFDEETTTTEHSIENASPSPHKSLSHDSSQDTDHTPSQASSTETIVQSPKKQDSGPKDDDDSILSEISGLGSQNEQDKSKDESRVIDLNKIDNGKQEEEDQIDVECAQQESKSEKKELVDSQLPNVLAETEKKLEIFIPTPDLGSQEGYDSSEQDKDTSLEGSIGEEIVEEQYEESEREASGNFVDSREDAFALQSADKKQEEDHSGSQSLDFIASGKDASSEKSNENLSKVFQKIDSVEDVHPMEVDDGQAHSLRTQRLVDDISNNLLASMMKETSQLFTSILKERNTSSDISDVKVAREEPSVSSVGERSLPKTKTEVQPPHLDDESKNKGAPATHPEDPPTSSVSSSKSQILKRVSDLIAEGNTSPRSPSVTSPRQNELVLTPQLTFDLSPDVLSPASSTPASPTKVSVGLDNRLPEKSAPFDKTSQQEQEEIVSPTHSPSKGHGNNLDMAALTNKLLNIAATPDLDLDDKLGQLDGDDTEFSVEGIEGNWFDDDFWTSADNRKKQQQLKAEEERIAAELFQIARLEELQRLQEQFPGLVIREVPNKPPPPYTPPTSTTPPSLSSVSPSASPTMPPAYSVATPRGDEVPLKTPSPVNTISVPHRLSKADLRKLATEIFHVVPSRKEEVMNLVKDALDCLHEAWERGLDPSLVEPPESFITSSPPLSQNEDSSEEEEEGSARIFRQLLFSLTREIVSEAYQHQHTPVPPPWIKQPFPPTKILLAVRTSSKPSLYAHAEEKVKVLFGWSPSSKKESLMMRWARKHRDLVDQVLVRELQAEESSWTQYDEDEASVKVQVASEILDDLVSDTVTVFTEIIARKMTLIGS